jgi:hypothetical protein
MKHALMITSFVLMMMLLIEYINVQTRGEWQKSLKKSRFGQYVLAAFLGVVPGCLGAFTVVSLYSHRMVSFGALVAAMIATSGDEAFVMLSMFPLEALWLNLILFVTALVAAYAVDLLFKNQNRFLQAEQHEFEVHKEESCRCFSSKGIVRQLKHMSFPRAFLMTLFTLFLAAIFLGELGPKVWDWKKITFSVGAALSLFIITTVPDHFLEKHLYEHQKASAQNIFMDICGAVGRSSDGKLCSSGVMGQGKPRGTAGHRRIGRSHPRIGPASCLCDHVCQRAGPLCRSARQLHLPGRSRDAAAAGGLAAGIYLAEDRQYHRGVADRRGFPLSRTIGVREKRGGGFLPVCRVTPW